MANSVYADLMVCYETCDYNLILHKELILFAMITMLSILWNIDKITSQYSWIRTIWNHIEKWFLFDSFVLLFHHCSLSLLMVHNLFSSPCVEVDKIIITHLFYSVQSIHHTFHFLFIKNSLFLYSWIQHHLTIQSLPLTQTQYL